MPLPDRYEKATPEMTELWGTKGTFTIQSEIWYAQCEARNQLYGAPTSEELELIKSALILSPEDIDYLSIPEGHETNRFLRRIQSRLPKEVGNYLHKGNTSRDLLDPATSLQILRSLGIIQSKYYALAVHLSRLALKHELTLSVARTHGQHAVPITFGRQVLGWYAGVERSMDRVQRSIDIIGFGKGSGEVGTNIFIDPEVEELSLGILGLKVEPAPTQVIPRDRHAEVVVNMAVNSAELARIATNIRNMGRTEIGELQEPFDEKTQQASSSMPGKINTELTERVVGLSRRVKSATSEALETLVVWDEGEMANSSIERFTFPDVFGCLDYQLSLMNTVFGGLRVNTERMAQNLDINKGAIYGSRLFNVILETGLVERTEAYEIARDLALRALREGVQMRELVVTDERANKYLSPEKLQQILSPDFYLRNIRVAYKRLDLR